MKKLVNIDNRLFENLKRESEVSGSNMNQIINVAIAKYLQKIQLQDILTKNIQSNNLKDNK